MLNLTYKSKAVPPGAGHSYLLAAACKVGGAGSLDQLKEEDLLLLGHLRNNSREKLTNLSKKTLLPISTIHEKLKKFTQTLNWKNTILVDFSHLGYNVKTHTLLKVENGDKIKINQYLAKHVSVNNLFRINNGYDYIFDAYFKTLNDSETFFEKIELEYKVRKRETFYVLDEIKREGLLGSTII